MKLKSLVISLIIMSVTSFLSLLIFSVLTYLFKWQADIAMMGITFTYILAGLMGGLSLKLSHLFTGRKENLGVPIQNDVVSIGAKMLEAVLLATLFMGILLFLSLTVANREFEVSGRFLTIWMLLVGSVSLARIL